MVMFSSILVSYLDTGFDLSLRMIVESDPVKGETPDIAPTLFGVFYIVVFAILFRASI